MKKKILVVDDEPDIVRTISIMLEMEDYEVITAGSGEDALKQMRVNTPDLLLLDVILPGINGKEVAAILKKDTRYQKVPIIIITAQTQKSDLATLEESGADFYMTKPFDSSVLKDKIEKLLNRQNKAEQEG
ncbi:MAG: response regulator [Candidatus Omnitrophota bacterium]